ncbi:SWI/SNF complex component SNF12 homolog [Impatiens glandulifera]|uniref:SWI/SNF complex component SNF12 homolog n=1 Tax=Impatiens glandulifera TaxID=253017 RepID=UPI001FB0F340|nr:SWI/SNF complex component SNF12 homolog [Impatiens glandulifera]
MSGNNNNPSKHMGSSSPFGNVGIGPSNLPANPTAHLQGQSLGYPGQFQMAQLSAAQAQALAQAQSKAQAHAQAQAQAAHAQFQAQLQAQGLTIPNLGSSSPANSLLMKRPLLKPSYLRPHGMPAPNMVSPMRNMDLMASVARNKKKQKLPEKQFHERVSAILPESALYTQLLEFESRVDSALVRKKIDIAEALKNPPTMQKTLRIFVFNTFANQSRAIPKKQNSEPPTWTMKIVGRILEDGVDPEQAGLAQKTNSSYPKFSSFFKRVTISLDQRQYPENHVIVWDAARSPQPHEGFEVKRKGDKEFSANIRLEMNYMPEKCKLSPPLMEVLGIEVDTRPRILAAIWHYVKARKLQNPNDPSFFHCDAPLLKVFGEEKVKFTMIPQMISHHLSPPQPIHLEHKIKLAGNSPVGEACYDVSVDVPFPIQKDLHVLLANTERSKEVEGCEEDICSLIRKIHDHRKRRSFFLGFSQSPVEFINALVVSQRKDLRVASGEGSRNAEKERRPDFFNQQWVEDAVIRYLNRKPPVVDSAGAGFGAGQI